MNMFHIAFILHSLGLSQTSLTNLIVFFISFQKIASISVKEHAHATQGSCRFFFYKNHHTILIKFSRANTSAPEHYPVFHQRIGVNRTT